MANDNYTIQEALEAFLNHCKHEKHLSSKTLKAYATDLMQFRNFITTHFDSPPIKEINKIIIRSYLEAITVLKPKSIKRKIASTKALFNYLEFEDIISVNPFRKMHIKIKEPQHLPKAMNMQEVNLILQAAYRRLTEEHDLSAFSYFESLRNVLVIELLFATGARVSEISTLSISQINFSTGEIILRGKGNKERCVQVCHTEALAILNQYFNRFKSVIESSGGYLLVNRFGKGLSDQSIRGIIKSLLVGSGSTKHVTPHMFRHTLATLLLENGVDIKYIQTILGHSNITTTQIYTHVNSAKQRQILQTKHPRIAINLLEPG